MSFGNRSNFCSLKDAFPDFQRVPEKIINAPPEITFPFVDTRQHTYTPDAGTSRVVEKFDGQAEQTTEQNTIQGKLDYHCPECEYRKKYGSISTGFNEILNLLLLLLLLYIVIYKPKI